MCEFCTQHGEGKKWYLQMRNYSEILLHEEFSSSQRSLAGVTTRVEWWEGHFAEWLLPAITGVSEAQEEPEDASSTPSEVSEPPLSEEEILARRKARRFGQVLPIEDVEKVIDIVSSVTRLPCGCRFHTTGKTDKRYCFGLGIDKLGILGKYPDVGSFEVLDKEEAKEILRGYDEEGLIHNIFTFMTPYVADICNCDHDCLLYRGYIERGGTPAFFRAEYVCQTDWDLCRGCKSCMSQCQFGAQFYSSALEKVYIDPSRCFGCGVCRAVCPHDAVTLIPRQEVPEAADLWLRDRA
jgi:ferredoxin